MNKENNIDNISRNLLKAANITNAPEGFTTNIMSKIEAQNNVELTVYKPLISKLVWFLIALIALFTTIIALLFNETTGTSVIKESIPNFNYSFIESINFSLPSIQLSDISIISIAIFGIFFFIQLIIIDKNSRTNIS